MSWEAQVSWEAQQADTDLLEVFDLRPNYRKAAQPHPGEPGMQPRTPRPQGSPPRTLWPQQERSLNFPWQLMKELEATHGKPLRLSRSSSVFDIYKQGVPSGR